MIRRSGDDVAGSCCLYMSGMVLVDAHDLNVLCVPAGMVARRSGLSRTQRTDSTSGSVLRCFKACEAGVPVRRRVI